MNLDDHDARTAAQEIKLEIEQLECATQILRLDNRAWRAIRAVPASDWPEVMTADEAVRFLRLDEPGGPRDPYQALYRYRRQLLLRAVQIGRRVMYTKKELVRFLERKTEGNR